MPRDYYADLGVNKNASAEEIKEAYKRLAKQFHPDVSKEKDAEEKFKHVNEAYRVLSDPQKRQNFDQFGDASEKFSGFSGFEGFARNDFDFSDLFEGFGFGDSFSEMFGGIRGQTQAARQRGRDIVVNLPVSFEEAAFGAQKEFFVERNEKCEKCQGEGFTEKGAKAKCDRCHGSGFQQSTNRTILGTITTRSTCSKCRGAGEVIIKPCTKCSGKGVEKKREKISVKIPAGVESGYRLRLKGKGDAGHKNASQGDLFLLLFVEPHKHFKRDHEDIFSQEEISFSDAALGSSPEIATIKGNVSLRIPKGTQSGTVFKLKGQGIKSETSGRQGDQFVKIIVKTPQELSRKQKELFEELAKDEGKARKKGFFE